MRKNIIFGLPPAFLLTVCSFTVSCSGEDAFKLVEFKFENQTPYTIDITLNYTASVKNGEKYEDKKETLSFSLSGNSSRTEKIETNSLGVELRWEAQGVPSDVYVYAEVDGKRAVFKVKQGGAG